MCQVTDELYLEYLRGRSFLEVACGEGHLLRKLRDKYPAARFAGVWGMRYLHPRLRTGTHEKAPAAAAPRLDDAQQPRGARVTG
jgi:hypothetical protein